jgi:hypothetical protein
MRAIIAQNIVLGNATRLDLLNAKTSMAAVTPTTTAAKPNPNVSQMAELNVKAEIRVQ